MSRRKTEFSGTFAYLKKQHLTNLDQVVYFDAQDAKNEFTWPLNTLKYRFNDLTKDVFRTSRGKSMSSQSLEISKSDY
jgi:hypothetical protein